MPAQSRSGQLRAQRREEGRCVSCGATVEPDAKGYRKAQCPDCLRQRQQQTAQLLQKRRTNYERIHARVEEMRYAAEKGQHESEHQDWCLVLGLVEKEIATIDRGLNRQTEGE